MTKEDLYRDIYQHFTTQVIFLIKNIDVHLQMESEKDSPHPAAYYNSYQYLDLYIKTLQELQSTLDKRFSALEMCPPEERAETEKALCALVAQLRCRTQELVIDT